MCEWLKRFWIMGLKGTFAGVDGGRKDSIGSCEY